MKFHFNNVLFITIALLLATRLFGLTHNTYWAKTDHRYWSIQEEGNNNDKILTKIALLRIPFVENQGQISEEGVRYYAKTFGGTVFITKDGELIYSLPKFETGKVMKGWVIKESFIGASIVDIEGENEAITRMSNFKGKDASKWRTNIPTYNMVNLGEIYEGIELKLQAYGKNIEKLFHVKAGANPEHIRVKIDGAKHLAVNGRSELEVTTELGNVTFTKPVAYQEENGEKKFIEIAYEVQNDVYGFNVGAYDRTKGLVIDPLLASTFIGGSGNDYGHAITLDANGNVYITGYTLSSNFPTTPGAYDTSYNGDQEVFVSKLDSDLTTLSASSYLGGSVRDGCQAITLDDSGNVYLAGWTNSADFPTTPNAYDTSYNSGVMYEGDAFISKLDNNLTTLLASTFIGGSDADEPASGVAIAENGDIFITGKTWSDDYPTTPGAYDETHNDRWDVYISRLDSDLTTLIASTLLGGSINDRDPIMTIDRSGNIYVTGETWSSDFPTTPDAFDTTFNGGPNTLDVYVSKLNDSLTTLVASTFLGSSSDDIGLAVNTDETGDVYVSGWASSGFPTTPGAYDTVMDGGKDTFISRLDSNLTTLVASTFLGGGSNDWGQHMILDGNGNVYVTGYTFSTDFPTTPNAFDTSYNGGYGDVFVSKLDSNLTTLTASTYLGGSEVPGVGEQSHCLSIDENGNVYVVGMTPSSDFPTVPGAYDESHNGGRDIFVSKFDSDLSSGLSIEEETSQSIFSYLQISPNPFRDKTDIRWQPAPSSGARPGITDNSKISIKIYDVSGRLIRDFPINQFSNSPINQIVWNGVDNADQKLPSGVYFLEFQFGEHIETQKLLLLR